MKTGKRIAIALGSTAILAVGGIVLYKKLTKKPDTTTTKEKVHPKNREIIDSINYAKPQRTLAKSNASGFDRRIVEQYKNPLWVM